MLLDSLRQGVLSVLEHFDHELQFLVQLREGILLLLHELLFNLNDVVFEDLALLQACFDLLRQGVLLLDCGIDLILWLKKMIRDSVAFMLSDHAFRTHINLAVLAKILCFLLRMLQTKLVNKRLFLHLLSLDAMVSPLA